MRRPQIKLMYFCIDDGNSPLFTDQLLIKRSDDAPRKVKKYPADSGAPNDGFPLITLKTLFRLSRVLLDL